MDPRRDPDLDFLHDPELRELGRLLASGRLPEPPLDPAFQSSLRRRLRQQHWEMLETSLPWWRRLTAGPSLAWSGAVVGAVMVAAAVLFAFHSNGTTQTLLVSSPLDHVHDVALVEPMKLQFTQPMDHQSVEAALQIEPATQVSYTWQGNTLIVQPTAGQLAPNTQYRMTLSPTATTASGQTLGKKTTVVFVTAAPPAPAPSASPSPVATGVALGRPVQLAPASADVAPAWSKDGSTVYFAGSDGSLQSVPVTGGTATGLNLQSVTQIATSPNDSSIAVISSGSVYLLPAAGGRSAGRVTDLSPLAIGWHGQQLLAAVPGGLVEVNANTQPGAPTVPFAAQAKAAVFSPDGGQVLYLDTGGQVHLVDVKSGHDATWQASVSALPVWSQDGHQVAFVTLQGVETAAPDGSGSAVLATFDQVGAQSPDGVMLAWSDGTVIVTTSTGLSGIDTSLRHPVQLASGSYSAVSAAPDHLTLAYVLNGELFAVPLQRPGVEDQLLVSGQAVLKSFLDARRLGDSAGAQKYLDAAGQQAYSRQQLIYSGEPHLARWFPVFAQAHSDGTVTAVVRLVLADRRDVEVSQLDEIVTLVPAGDSTLLVDAVTATAPRPVDGGPELVGVQVTSGQLQLQFDSDLDPAAVAAITVTASDGSSIAATPTYSNRVVTINLASVSPGTALQVTISTGLKDVGGRAAAEAVTIPVTLPSSS